MKDKQEKQITEICTNISASCKTKKRYSISEDIFREVYNEANSVRDVAEQLSCSADYVRRTAKKYGLPLLVQHGGARKNSGGRRPGAGRPKGSKNSEAIMAEREWMKRQLEIDQRTNSIEIGLNPQRIAVSGGDLYKFAGSAYRNNVRVVAEVNFTAFTSLPRELKAVLAKT